MSTEETDFIDPSGAGNFLQRYHQARAARTNSASSAATSESAPNTPQKTEPVAPPSPPLDSLRSKPIATGRTETAKSVWGAVFHPLGKSPTSADRYDLSPKQRAMPGFSTSEVHAKGSGISLDEGRDE